MRNMSKAIKPLIVIILAVGVAAGAAVYLSRGTEEPTDSKAPLHADIKGGGQIRGPLEGGEAQVTLVEFGDYQCPSCGAYHPFVKEILNRYPKQLRLEFHHYPLISLHPNAMAAAMAAEAAGEQGRYWEMHDALFEYQGQWSNTPNAEAVFLALASRIGLDSNAFMRAMRSPELQQRILKDVERAQVAKVEAVPTFFINGEQQHIKLSMDEFVQTIEAHLRK
jgi:protein-disulfide isomerase